MIYEAIRAIKSNASDYFIKEKDNDVILPMLAEVNANTCKHYKSFVRNEY